ncbi:DUF805 domain-containing protein [bacterium]|nr:DUF805 domain-containing protein [bacterium]
MNVFNYYIGAFKNFKDYQSFATRKEFNFFILFFLLIYMFFGILSFATIPFSIISNPNQAPDIFAYFPILSWGIFIIHLLPGLALIKRRLNDITPTKSNIIFRIFFGFEVFRICTGIFLSTKISAFQTVALSNADVIPPSFTYLIIFSLFNMLLNYICIGFYIFLMAKKGKQQ